MSIFNLLTEKSNNVLNKKCSHKFLTWCLCGMFCRNDRANEDIKKRIKVIVSLSGKAISIHYLLDIWFNTSHGRKVVQMKY